jgi:peptidylprolyl isomerase
MNLAKSLVLGTFAVALSFGAASCSSTEKNSSSGSSTPAKETVITLPSGLQYVEYTLGSGPAATMGQTVSVNTTGRLTDSTIFWSNLDPKFGPVEPLDFQLGTNGIIQGWNEGINGMKVGGRRRLIIPPSLGYGANGRPPVIPPNATLVFDVELMAIK